MKKDKKQLKKEIIVWASKLKECENQINKLYSDLDKLYN